MIPTIVNRPRDLEADRVFKDAYSTSPVRAFGKSEPEQPSAHLEGEEKVTDMIKSAMRGAQPIEDLARGYSGREQAKLAKLAATAGPGETAEVFFENGEARVRISKRAA